MNALEHVSGIDGATDELLLAAAEVDPRHPGYLTIAYHRDRLLIERGAMKEASEELTTVLGGDIPKSAINHFRSLRMRTALDLAGFLLYAQRIPVLITDTADMAQRRGSYQDYQQQPPNPKLMRLDKDSIEVLNQQAPLELWAQIAAGDAIPAHLQQELVLAAFARSVLLDRDETMIGLAPQVTRVLPEAGPFMAQVSSGTDVPARHFSAIHFLLHFATVRPYMTSGIAWIRPRVRATDSYTFNWWIPLGSPELDWSPNQWDRPQANPLPEVAAQFLKPEDRARGIEDRKQLASTGYAPNYLCQHVLAWAARHPQDPRVPEALHYAVATTRYAASNDESAEYSIRAYRLLHLRYGKSIWAKRTPTAYRKNSPW